MKPVGAGRTYVELETDPGFYPGQTADEIEPQKLGDLTLSDETTLGALDPVVFSELVYDIDSITS